MAQNRTYTLVYSVHAHVLVQFSARILNTWPFLRAVLPFLLQAVDIVHPLAQFGRGKVGERQTHNNDRSREVIGEVEPFGQLCTDNCEE